MDVIKYSFDEISAISRSLASTAKKHNFTYVIGIARGGLIPAAIISYELDIPLL
jgi:hypoxanthine phosphoribosyltransferase